MTILISGLFCFSLSDSYQFLFDVVLLFTVPDAPAVIDIVPTYSHEMSKLLAINTTFSETVKYTYLKLLSLQISVFDHYLMHTHATGNLQHI